MASTINATTSGIVNIGDSVATLALQTGGTTAVAIDTAQIVTLSKSLALLGSTSGSVALAAPAVAGTQSYTLPTAQPTANGQALTATTAGVMSWATASATPGGSSNQFQYNSGGSSFGGAANFTYNATGPIVSTTIGVGAATPSASGSGVSFPATQSASTDANTLDDYEEGSWTPSFLINSSATGITYSAQVGKYTKIGRNVNLTGYITLSSKGASTGNADVSGLPFTSDSTTNFNTSVTGVMLTSNNTTGQMWLQIISGANTIQLFYYDGTVANKYQRADNTTFNNTTTIYISVSYTTT
jgi:hypothetical protein